MSFLNHHPVQGSSSAALAPDNINNGRLHDHLHTTLERIDQIANEDVEMQGPLLEEVTFLVLDTNILLHHLEVIQEFVSDVERLALPLIVVIPGAVIHELDGQKNREGLAWFSRRASAWLLKKVKERKIVKSQAREETCKPSRNWKVKEPGEDFGSERSNDNLILDCCLYFQRIQRRRAFLCSADKILCIECENVGIPTIIPRRKWCSEEIAMRIFGDAMHPNQFVKYHINYNDPRAVVQSLGPSTPTEDGMDIDDDDMRSEVLLPSHALDLVHIQVVDHFTRLLVELVAQVGGPEIYRRPDGAGASVSRYAPAWSRQNYLDWSARDCLDYLGSKKRIPPSSPQLEIFLSIPYERGARWGHDWSRRDWEIALKALAALSDTWDDVNSRPCPTSGDDIDLLPLPGFGIRESLRVLSPHLEVIFSMPMRPTGM